MTQSACRILLTDYAVAAPTYSTACCRLWHPLPAECPAPQRAGLDRGEGRSGACALGGPDGRFRPATRALRRTATNILTAYVGRDAGARVLAGQIRRGDTQLIEAAIWISDAFPDMISESTAAASSRLRLRPLASASIERVSSSAPALIAPRRESSTAARGPAR